MAETKSSAKFRRTSKKKDSLADMWFDFKYWLLSWKANFGMMMKYEGKPLTKEQKKLMSEAQEKYPWMADLMKLGFTFTKMCEGRSGAPLRGIRMVELDTTIACSKAIQNIILDPDHTVMIHTMVPNEVFQAMGIKVCRMEQVTNSLTMGDQHAEEKYLDYMYNMGLLENTCTYSTQTPGMVLSGEYPQHCQAIITAAMPCEAHFEGYSMIVEKMGAPAYWLDLPYDNNDETNLWAYVEDIKGMIKFLEDVTGKTMDWDKLKYYCENHNKVIRRELERWEYNRTDCPPCTDDALWLSHFQTFHLETSTDTDVIMMDKLCEITAKAYENKVPAIKNIRYRAVIWSTPLFFYPTFWKWLEDCWGILVLMDMETFGTCFRLIDTSSRDKMLYGLADSWCHGTMARHLRGPAENWIDDLNNMVEMFRPDLILNLNHNNCRGHLGMTGYLAEWTRRKKVPTCNIYENFYDARICSRQGIRDQVNSFMMNIMHAEPLDKNLLVIDDDNEW